MREYTLEFLTNKAEAMLDYLAKPMPKNDNPDFHNDLIAKLDNLNIAMTQSGEYKTAAQYKIDCVIDNEIGIKINEIMDGKLATSTINMWVKSKAKDWNQLANAFDRINSSAVHQIDAIRSLLSWEKAKLNLL
jgi:hypothetical protein